MSQISEVSSSRSAGGAAVIQPPCSPLQFFEHIKDSLRYESDLGDRRVKFLLAVQSCVAVGYGYVHCNGAKFGDIPAGFLLAVLGCTAACLMLRAAVRGFHASRRYSCCWTEYCKSHGVPEESFPPVWGVKEKAGDGKVASRIGRLRRRAAEYYAALPLMTIVAWLVVLYFETFR